MNQMNTPITALPGIGEKTAKLYQKLELCTVGDLLLHLPRAYKDLSNEKRIADIKIGERAFLRVKVLTAPQTKFVRKGLEITTFQVTDTTGVLTVDIFNQRFLKTHLTVAKELYLYGTLEYQFGKIKISAPEIYFKKPETPYLPIYSLAAGLKQNAVRKATMAALLSTEIREPYSEEFLNETGMMGRRDAFLCVHNPPCLEQAQQARARLVFDELLVFNRMLEMLSEEQNGVNTVKITCGKEEILRFEQKLPFRLTNAQKKAMGDIVKDIGSPRLMNRMVQGDVGSGKTVLAFFAMDCFKNCGYQSILMAPTEILAAQHYETAKELFDESEIVLMTGSQKAKQRRENKEKLENGQAKIIIGTHALLYADADFFNLGLIITDEQHRFGVKQRARLSGGATDVHTLIMSATPIPRSLALVLYGKTDISVVDELPPGRKAVKTYRIGSKKYEQMLSFIESELKSGRQAYVVCPLIEEAETLPAVSAQEMHKELLERYPKYSVALLHGKLKNNEKAEIMQRFEAGEIGVLVSTTVIEVGVNVPNAAVMVIQSAERFGLAQMHQLRGRVGRGSAQAYCFLVSDAAPERLAVLCKTNDGFLIAEEDMKQRGSGELLGTRQSGTGSLKIANLITDMKLLLKARETLLSMQKNKRFAAEYAAITAMAKQKLNETLIEIALN